MIRTGSLIKYSLISERIFLLLRDKSLLTKFSKKMKDSINIQYLISSNQDASWGLTINTVGFQSIKAGSIYPLPNHPHNYLFTTQTGRILNEYQLIYIFQGEGVFESSSFKQSRVKAGNMILLFPDEWHNYHPEKETGWDEFWIGFNGNIINNCVLNGFFKKQNPVFNIGIYDNIVQLYRSAIQVSKEQQAGYQQMLSGIVNYFLGYAYSKDRQASSGKIKEIDLINRAKIIMLENFHKGITPENIARQISVSYSWFRRFFKQHTGLAPAQYIQELKIQKSKELLINTRLSSKEIAFEAGFENPEYFCYVFKKRLGKTPIKYRENFINR
jgi:AraC-like DNA-binding protein